MRKSNRLGLALLVLSLPLIASACHARPGGDERVGEEATVREIRTHVERYLDRPVLVAGAFMGWSGECKGAPPVTKSDWMLEDAGDCIYVHGRLPPGTRPMAPQGEEVSVRGVIRLAKDGLPYLEVDP